MGLRLEWVWLSVGSLLGWMWLLACWIGCGALFLMDHFGDILAQGLDGPTIAGFERAFIEALRFSFPPTHPFLI